MVVRIADPGDPRIADYRNVPDPQLLRRRGLFVAENRLVVRTLLASGRFRTRSVLLTDAAYEALRGQLGGVDEALPVFVCAKAMMEAISGYNIHRGCLALGERPANLTVTALLAETPGARRLVALEAVGNADNVGAVFRNARAFGADGVIAGPACCDPLYRKAIRVSIGASLVVPYATSEDGWRSDLLALKAAGFTLVALTPAPDARGFDEFLAGGTPRKIVLLVGHEGDGLSPLAQGLADARVRIAMAPGVDSLNVATATGIALHRIYR